MIRVLNPIIAHKGTYRCQCALDLQATFRKHEGSPAVFGVNAVIKHHGDPYSRLCRPDWQHARL